VKTSIHLLSYLTLYFLQWEYFRHELQRKLKHCFLQPSPPPNHAVYETMWKNIVERGRPQMTMWCMRILYWVTKATNAYSQYVILIAFPLQQWLQERSSMWRLNVHYNGTTVPSGPRSPHYRGFTITDTPQSVGLLWTSDQPDAETSTWQHNTHKRHIHAPTVFEPAIPVSEQPQTHALDRAATRTGTLRIWRKEMIRGRSTIGYSAVWL
jgi:hypothetical protein